MPKVKKSRVKLLHQYYKYTGFYSFIWQGVKSAILPTAIIVAILFYVNYKVINLNDALVYITQNFSDFFIFGVFLASESILGLIPPDIFIAWTKNTESPLLYLAILAFLSYLGGVIAYFMGMAIAAVPSINKHLSLHFKFFITCFFQELKNIFLASILSKPHIIILVGTLSFVKLLLIPVE